MKLHLYDHAGQRMIWIKPDCIRMVIGHYKDDGREFKTEIQTEYGQFHVTETVKSIIDAMLIYNRSFLIK